MLRLLRRTWQGNAMDIRGKVESLVALEISLGQCVGTVQIARELGISPSAVGRWISRGLPGLPGHRVRLEAVRRGRKWVTSRAALERFFAALPQNVDSVERECIAVRTSTQRHRDVERALAQARNLGIA